MNRKFNIGDKIVFDHPKLYDRIIRVEDVDLAYGCGDGHYYLRFYDKSEGWHPISYIDEHYTHAPVEGEPEDERPTLADEELAHAIDESVNMADMAISFLDDLDVANAQIGNLLVFIESIAKSESHADARTIAYMALGASYLDGYLG